MTRDIPGLDAMLHVEASRLAGHAIAAQGDTWADWLALGLWGLACVGGALGVAVFVRRFRK